MSKVEEARVRCSVLSVKLVASGRNVVVDDEWSVVVNVDVN